jgi:hypothetical protein
MLPTTVEDAAGNDVMEGPFPTMLRNGSPLERLLYWSRLLAAPTVVVERMGLRSKHLPQVVNVGALLPIHSGPGSLVMPLLLLL